MRFRSCFAPFAVAAFMAASGPAFAQSLEAGKIIFRKQCVSCHGLGPAAQFSSGPQIEGVFNRPIASLPNYEYSDALKGARGKWTARNLDLWLKNPEAFAPGTSMKTPLPDSKERSDLIVYLRTLR